MMHHASMSDHGIGPLGLGPSVGHMMAGCCGLSTTGTPICGVTGGAVRIEQHGNQIVHVRGDSDSDLEALFSVLNNIDGRGPPPASSFKNRKLPASFFKQPDHKMAAAALAVGNQQATAHGRSVSSPAQLHHTTNAGSTSSAGSAGGSTGQQPNGKIATGSVASAVEGFLQGGDMPIGTGTSGGNGAGGNAPATCNGGWEASKACPRYYNMPHGTSGIWQQQQEVSAQQHISMTSHPVYQQQGRPGNAGSAMTHANNSGAGQTPGSASGDFGHHGQLDPHGLGPLPQGWEQGITQDGEIYYINHIDKTTSWQDPRISRQRQTTAQTRMGAGPQGVQPHPIMSSHPHAIHLQQQQQQPQHSHVTGKQQIMQTAHHQMMANGNGPQVGSGVAAQRPAHSEHFICLELQKLHKEKERLQQEQEAINCRELMLNEMVRQSSVSSTPCGGAASGVVGVGGSDGQMKEGTLAMLHAMHSLYGTSIDSSAFINQCNAAGSTSGTSVMEAHARQNSTDSGLGGMGTAYSLPRSPDDYLSNVDEMDMQEDLGSCMTNQAASCYAMSSGQNAADIGLHHHQTAAMHMPSMCDMLDVNGVMENEQLVCSITGDVTSELLSDMDVQKMDRLLWL